MKKIRLYLCIFLCFLGYSCIATDPKDFVYHYIVTSDSSISPDGQKFFFLVVYGTKYQKFTRPYVYNTVDSTCILLNPDNIYLSSKPDWNTESSNLITTMLSEKMQYPADDGDDDGAFEELFKYLRKYEKFKELEAKYKKREIISPRLCVIEIPSKKMRFLEDLKKEKLYGLKPKFSTENNKIFYVAQIEMEQEDEIKEQYDLMQFNLLSLELTTIIEDTKYDSFYPIPDTQKLIFCNKDEDLGIIEIFDYQKKQSQKIPFGKEKHLIVKDVILKRGMQWAIILTEDENGFENLWILDLAKINIREIEIGKDGWFCKPKIFSENEIEYVINQKQGKKIVRNNLLSGESIYEDISQIGGDIIDFDKEIIFYIDLKKNLVSWSRNKKEKRIIFPDKSFSQE